MVWLIAICIALSIAASLLFVPAVRELATWVGMVDRPDQERKLHRRPVALGGGLAVFLALLTAFSASLWIDRAYFDNTLGAIEGNWWVLFGAAAALLLVGLIDDAWTLRGRQKLLLQCLVLAALVGSGTLIEKISLLGYNIELGTLAFPLTVLWLLVSVNALNLIDGADGVATTVGCVICAGLGVLSLHHEAGLSALLAFALAGALLGFLAFNRPPATIYLGDAGSMMIGLCVGVLAVWSNFKESTVLASAPVAILAIPLFDSTAAVLRRWLTGRSIYATDRAHLHHLLQQKFGPVRMLVVVAGLCITTTTLSVLSVIFEQPWLAALGVAIVLGLLIFTRSFGHAEFRLLIGTATQFAQSFATNPQKCDKARRQHRVPLQGSGRWDTIWEPLIEFAKIHELAKVKIDLNLAWLHEGYHASWQSIRLPDKAFQLSVCVPLFTRRGPNNDLVHIGRLEIIASADDPTIYQRIADFSERMADLGPEIDAIVAKLESKGVRSSEETSQKEEKGGELERLTVV